jgi:hypothetical protein
MRKSEEQFQILRRSLDFKLSEIIHMHVITSNSLHIFSHAAQHYSISTLRRLQVKKYVAYD